MSSRTTHRAAVLAAAALLLAACTGDDGGTEPAPAEPGPAASATPSSPEETTGADGAGEGADNPAAAEGPAAAAAATAEGTLSGSRAVALDRDDDGAFEVEVVAAQQAREVTVSADGAEVTREEDTDVDSEDRQALDAASLSMVDAIAAALAAVPGEVEEVDLDPRDDGDETIWWEVGVRTGDGEDRDVRVDAVSGETRVEN